MMTVNEIHRICILATPRSGSQFVANVIANNVKDMVDLTEPFEDSLPTRVVLSNDKVHLVDTHNKATRDERIADTLYAISKADITQRIVMRVFPKNYKTDIQYTFEHLKRMGFKFLVLRRNDTHAQLLSYGIAMASNIWSTRDQGNKALSPVMVDAEKINDMMRTLSEFDTMVNNLRVTHDTIYYHTAISDLEKYLNTRITSYSGAFKKQAPSDPIFSCNKRNRNKRINNKLTYEI